MKNIKNIFTLLVVALIGLSLTACNEDDLGTNQYKGGVSLNAFGPNPVMRGGQLRFVGSNLDQVASIDIPGIGAITNITVVKAGVPSEIRVTVPKDGPIEGVITLTTKTGTTITTKNELAFIEPIEITGFSPASVMPGDIVKIEGDYLNLVHSLAFADGVLVSENDFVSHDRYYIEVAVPEEAQTGKLELYTADLTIQLTKEEEDKLEYQIMTTDEALEVGVPTTTKLASERGAAGDDGVVTVKAGEDITFTGTYYNVVAAVKFGNVEVPVEPSADGKSITVTLPAEAPDGGIFLACKSGVEVPVGTLNTVKPSNCVATPNPVKAGTVLTINGQDMDVVTSILFDNVADAITIEPAADKVTVTVPAEAKEGELQLVMANGATVAVPFTLVKPTVTGYDNNPVSAGGALTIQGTDLDLVTSVQFGDGSDIVAVKDATATAITLSVPMNALSGSPILKLANGDEVANVPAITINEAVFCYFTELPAEDAELKAGESLILPVANGDKLTAVEINGTNCQFVLTKNKTELIIGVPDKAKKGSKVRLISSNGEISYTIDFIPNTEVTTVLWTGTAVADDWGNQPYVLSDAGQELKDAGVVAGDVINFHIVPMEAAWKLQIVEGHWGATYASICSFGNDTEGGKFTEYDLDANKGYYSLVVTQEMLDAAFTQQWWGGVFLFNGDNVIVDKITTTHYESLETTLWQGEAIADDWGNQPFIFSDAGAELAAVEAKAGQTIWFYFTPLEEAWKVQIYEGHWGPTYASICSIGNDTESGKFTEYDLAGNGGKYGLELTQEMLDAAYTQQWWGGVFLLNGDNIKCTKVTIE